MKIAHISFMPSPIAGVLNKTKAMARARRDIKFIILNNDKEGFFEGLHFIKFRPIFRWLPLKTQQKIFTLKLIENSLNLGEFDFFVLRYPGAATLGALGFFKKYRDKIITEHHTNEDVEYKGYKKYGAINYIKYSLEPLLSRLCLPYTRAIVAVSSSILELELQKAGHKRGVVITNTLECEMVKKTGYKKFDGKTLEICAILSNLAPWHGVDRLVSAINSYKGPVKARLHIVGLSDSSLALEAPHELIYHGYKSGAELDSICQGATLGLSSLAFHRNQVFSASAIKTREYIARGLPFIYGYSDDDLNGDEVFALRLKSDESPIDFSQVVEFAAGLKVSSDEMREFARAKFDYAAKFKELEKLLKERA